MAGVGGMVEREVDSPGIMKRAEEGETGRIIFRLSIRHLSLTMIRHRDKKNYTKVSGSLLALAHVSSGAIMEIELDGGKSDASASSSLKMMMAALCWGG
jgi:hypothetical protein